MQRAAAAVAAELAAPGVAAAQPAPSIAAAAQLAAAPLSMALNVNRKQLLRSLTGRQQPKQAARAAAARAPPVAAGVAMANATLAAVAAVAAAAAPAVTGAEALEQLYDFLDRRFSIAKHQNFLNRRYRCSGVYVAVIKTQKLCPVKRI